MDNDSRNALARISNVIARKIVASLTPHLNDPPEHFAASVANAVESAVKKELSRQSTTKSGV